MNELLARWPVTAPLEELMPLIDEIILKRFPDSADAERWANRLVVAMSFLWHRRKDSPVGRYFIEGQSGSVVHPALPYAILRIVAARPDTRLSEPLDSDQVLRLMAEDPRAK